MRLLVRAVSLLLLVLVAAGLVWAGLFQASGGRWERVETPSMGTTAPVGTLLAVRPTDFDSLAVGDFISFHPPGRPDVTYSHRVAVIHDDGTVGTQGDIASPDPWRLHAGDVVGRVDHVWKGVGWIVRATPVLAIGAVVTWLLVWLVRERSKLPVAILGGAVVLTVAVMVYQPLTQAEQLAFVPVGGGEGGAAGAKATYVSTGLLPIRVAAYDGPHVDLRAGEVGSVVATEPDDDGELSVGVRPHVPPIFWVLLVLGCFTPALGTLVVGVRPAPPPRHSALSTIAA